MLLFFGARIWCFVSTWFVMFLGARICFSTCFVVDIFGSEDWSLLDSFPFRKISAMVLLVTKNRSFLSWQVSFWTTNADIANEYFHNVVTTIFGPTIFQCASIILVSSQYPIITECRTQEPTRMVSDCPCGSPGCLPPPAALGTRTESRTRLPRTRMMRSGSTIRKTTVGSPSMEVCVM